MNRLRLAARKRDELIVAAAVRDCLNKVVSPFGLAILARKSQVATKRNALIPVRNLNQKETVTVKNTGSTGTESDDAPLGFCPGDQPLH